MKFTVTDWDPCRLLANSGQAGHDYVKSGKTDIFMKSVCNEVQDKAEIKKQIHAYVCCQTVNS